MMIGPLVSAQMGWRKHYRYRGKRSPWTGSSKTQRDAAKARRRARQHRAGAGRPTTVTWTTTDGRTHRRRFPSKAAADRFARTLRARQ